MKLDLTDYVAVRPLDIDDYSAVRYLHTSATRAFSSEHLTIDEVDALIEHIQSVEYIDKMQVSDPMGAWIEGELAGSCGWLAGDDTGNLARIMHLYVSPLFSGCGLGRLLLNEAEKRAMNAGFTQIGVRSIASAAPFFSHMDYDITSYGVQALSSGINIPVVFLRKSRPMRGFADMLPTRMTPMPRHVTLN
jgi:GNAT superfamily N-acetyltransferase